MKRSRSGTASRASPASRPFMLGFSIVFVAAFVASFVFGLKRDTKPEQKQPVAVERPQPAVVHDARARVEVFKGAGKPGLARVATAQLRDAGFDVVQFGNAPAPSATSQVLDRIGNASIAAEVAKALGITNVKTVIDTTRYVEATVILGRDWPKATSAPSQRAY